MPDHDVRPGDPGALEQGPGARLGNSRGHAEGAQRMIDVGGHRLYIECSGSGGPAVILQPGLGATSSAWASIAPAVAATTTVCIYDRAGHGRSDEAGSQDGIALATDMSSQMARPAMAGGQTQPRTSMRPGPGWNTIRPIPIDPRTAAGTAVQTCGWALKRLDRRPMRPQPRPKAKSTDPVTSGSGPPVAKVKVKATARAAPARSEPRMANRRASARSAGRVVHEKSSEDAGERVTGSPRLDGHVVPFPNG